MTVRHIVSWKMNGETAQERAQQADEVAEALRTLPGVVPGLTALEVHLNEYNSDANWDVVLVSEHTDKEALDVYAVHPAHVAVAELVKARAAARAGLDFEV